MTNEGLLDKSAHVMLVPCSEMIGRTLALDSIYYNDIIITTSFKYHNTSKMTQLIFIIISQSNITAAKWLLQCKIDPAPYRCSISLKMTSSCLLSSPINNHPDGEDSAL